MFTSLRYVLAVHRQDGIFPACNKSYLYVCFKNLFRTASESRTSNLSATLRRTIYRSPCLFIFTKVTWPLCIWAMKRHSRRHSTLWNKKSTTAHFNIIFNSLCTQRYHFFTFHHSMSGCAVNPTTISLFVLIDSEEKYWWFSLCYHSILLQLFMQFRSDIFSQMYLLGPKCESDTT